MTWMIHRRRPCAGPSAAPHCARAVFCWPLLGILGLVGPCLAATQISLPLGRTAYQTNESIPLAVVRSDAAALPAGTLALRLTDPAGGTIELSWPVPAVPVIAGQARRTEHLQLNARLLRPQAYTLTVTVDGAAATQPLEVYSHVRKTPYRLINWGKANADYKHPEELLPQGEDGLGYNLYYGLYRPETDLSNLVRAGCDYMPVCSFGGGHQLNLRLECDWSDPYVLKAIAARASRRALVERTKSNCLGIHFYDEPGLTWRTDPVTQAFVPFNIPWQDRSYEAAYGRTPPRYTEVDANNPELVQQWRDMAEWKMGLMPAAWRAAVANVTLVRPDLLSLTQSQYAPGSFTDGYYFNVDRTLSHISGHGAYDSWGPGYFNPSFAVAFTRARDDSRDDWYLPFWHGDRPSDRIRLEQYLCFTEGIQGLMTPPDHEPTSPSSVGREGMVQANKLMARLGPIFTTMARTRQPVAALYSLSNMLDVQVRTLKGPNPIRTSHEDKHGKDLWFAYVAGLISQHPLNFVVEEDVIDGTLAARHRVLLLCGIDYLDPAVVTGLQQFIKQGGLVMKTADCAVQVPGAVELGVKAELPDQAAYAAAVAAGDKTASDKYYTTGKFLAGATPLARAMTAQLDKLGIPPVFTTDVPTIVAGRQGEGDIEYLFAINSTFDPNGGDRWSLAATIATLGLPDPGRHVYDAVLGGDITGQFRAEGGRLTRPYRFGPGQMRVFARTARPIGGVQAGTPTVQRDYTLDKLPLSVTVRATLADNQGKLLVGSAPLQIRVLDPAGNTRYDLYRATRGGSYVEALPLALNDPAGRWTVEIRDLLANTTDRTSFELPAVVTAGALGGLERRAVSFGDDRDRINRFFQNNHNVVVAIGTGVGEQAAAERLQAILKPWNVKAAIVPAAELNKPRAVDADEAPTGNGLNPGKLVVGDKNPIDRVGFAIDSPVVLLGNPEDNPLIKFAQDQFFLPYKAQPGSFPGTGRGYLAWQRDAVSYGYESVTAIAYDEAGLAEAVGSLYEAAAGVQRPSPLQQPVSGSLTPGTARPAAVAGLRAAWQAVVPDGALWIKTDAAGATVLSRDGTLTAFDAAGKPTNSKLATTEERAAPPAAPLTKDQAAEVKQAWPATQLLKTTVVAADGRLASTGWGGYLQLLDPAGKLLARQRFDQDVSALAWAGDRLVLVLADGRVLALEAGGGKAT